MSILILGLALWVGAHFFKRVAPAQRGRLGEAGKGIVAVLIVASVVLMVIGYRSAPYIQIWWPPAFLAHLNNLLVLLAFYLFAASGAKTWITTKIRHPQLTAVKLWAVAHLLVNGHLAAMILFGGLLAWAVAEVIVINRTTGAWVRPAPAPMRKEITAVVATVVIFVVVALVHYWLGVSPFGVTG